LTLATVDYLVLALYFAFVIGIGWLLKKKVSTSSDFLTSGRSLPLWITSLAFIATNLGAQEVIGMCGSGAKYGIMQMHFYWLGAIPAMLFVGLFMMPFYYGSRARSVPEYLKLRFDEKTRTFNAVSFAVMTIFSSGVSMHVLGKLFQLVLGWNYLRSVLLAAAIVLVYTTLGGLTSAIYNEVLQFFLIVLGFAPLSILAVMKAGGWSGIRQNLAPKWTHAWQYMGNAADNPMGSDMFSVVVGLGFVLSFGYWCTNFLVVQRAMAADSMSSARRTPIVAAFPKMFMPLIVILPGIAALALAKMHSGYALPMLDGKLDADMVMISLMGKFYPAGLLGVGITALMASFMSGMAGNVTAFNTVCTYDLYQGHIRKGAPDSHYLMVGRVCTLVGTLLSVAAAWVAHFYKNIMDLLQLVFGVVNAPLFATFLLGMFWLRATGLGAFSGLVSGTAAGLLTLALTMAEDKGGWIANLHTFRSTMAQNFWIAMVSFAVCFLVTVLLSVVGKAKPLAELKGLVWGATERPRTPAGEPWHKRPVPLALVALGICVAINIWLW
jgi:SSS family solute:Na+ symporter